MFFSFLHFFGNNFIIYYLFFSLDNNNSLDKNNNDKEYKPLTTNTASKEHFKNDF